MKRRIGDLVHEMKAERVPRPSDLLNDPCRGGCICTRCTNRNGSLVEPPERRRGAR